MMHSKERSWHARINVLHAVQRKGESALLSYHESLLTHVMGLGCVWYNDARTCVMRFGTLPDDSRH